MGEIAAHFFVSSRYCSLVSKQPPASFSAHLDGAGLNARSRCAQGSVFPPTSTPLRWRLSMHTVTRAFCVLLSMHDYAWENMECACFLCAFLCLFLREILWWVADVDTLTSTLSVCPLCDTVLHGPARKRPLLFSSTPVLPPPHTSLFSEHDCNWLQIRWWRDQ